MKDWADYALDLTGTPIANELNTDAYNLYDENGNPYADWTNDGITIQESQNTLPDQPQESQPENKEGE